MTIYIYALVDPFTEETRYIGKTIRPKERLQNQCNERSNTHRCHWIQSVIQKGSRPQQIILEELPDGSDWQSREKYWIAYGRKVGWPLTNGTDGGDGVVNLTPDSREKIRRAWLGRKHTPESRRKMSEAIKGKKHTEEYKQYMRRIMKTRVFTEIHRKRLSKANQKLTMDDACVIRMKLKYGAKQKDLAEIYGVNKGTISNIKRNVSYKVNYVEFKLPDWLKGSSK